MFKFLCINLLLVALLPTTPLAQSQLEEIKARAEECDKALLTGDYGRVVDIPILTSSNAAAGDRK